MIWNNNNKGWINLREIRFTIEEVVKEYRPTESVREDGTIDSVQMTKGFAEINDENEVETLIVEDNYGMNDWKSVKKDSVIAKVLNRIFK